MWQGPRLDFVAETGTYATIAAFNTIFLLLALILLFFLSVLSPIFLFFAMLRPRNRHLFLFSTSFLLRVLLAAFLLSHLHSVSFQGSFCSYVRGWRVSCAAVPGTLAFDLLTLIHLRLFWFSVSPVTTQFLSPRMKNQDGHWVYC